MKALPQLEPTLLTDSHETRQTVSTRTVVTDFAYQQHPGAETTAASIASTKRLPELTTFRALNRQVFGAEAHREFIKEAIFFGWMMAVAAWPLTVTLNQLGTMMISSPPW